MLDPRASRDAYKTLLGPRGRDRGARFRQKGLCFRDFYLPCAKGLGSVLGSLCLGTRNHVCFLLALSLSLSLLPSLILFFSLSLSLLLDVEVEMEVEIEVEVEWSGGGGGWSWRRPGLAFAQSLVLARPSEAFLGTRCSKVDDSTALT